MKFKIITAVVTVAAVLAGSTSVGAQEVFKEDSVLSDIDISARLEQDQDFRDYFEKNLRDDAFAKRLS